MFPDDIAYIGLGGCLYLAFYVTGLCVKCVHVFWSGE